MASTDQRGETSKPLGKLLIDRRAHRLVNADFHREEILTTKELAAWLGVSVQFLEIGRTRGYGPEFKRLTDKIIRYRVGDVIDWLKSRTHACTSDYHKGAR
ncbi:helix-turn-helix transcriptional regulator [Bradyrhizobium sp. LLZ17]|uniref:Helix-turn-helix transcriptional regulator n=1 Tax=Bradyrhizobium sp. LLZ17 TaxID=3239388 RepID=A0AB39XMG0_9BRAD